MVIIDVQRKRYNETIPSGDDNKIKNFSVSKKFTRVTNGINKYKTSPHVKRFTWPNDGFYEVWGQLVKENKKKWASLPFVD